MGTVTYKNQPGTASVLKQGTPINGTSHVYTVKKILWPSEVEEFIKSQLIGKTLHLCCGKSVIGDVRVDIDDKVNPTIWGDATKIEYGPMSYDTVLADPPYNGKFQWNHDLLSIMARTAKQRIIFQHWFLPADKKGFYKKDHSFRLTSVHVWQPRTYFGRVQVISIFDRYRSYGYGGGLINDWNREWRNHGRGQ